MELPAPPAPKAPAAQNPLCDKRFLMFPRPHKKNKQKNKPKNK